MAVVCVWGGSEEGDDGAAPADRSYYLRPIRYLILLQLMQTLGCVTPVDVGMVVAVVVMEGRDALLLLLLENLCWSLWWWGGGGG